MHLILGEEQDSVESFALGHDERQTVLKRNPYYGVRKYKYDP